MAITLVILLILSAIFLAAWLIFRKAFYSPPRKHPTMDDPLQGEEYEAAAEHLHRVSHIMARYPFEAVKISASDGTPLFARYYHMRDGAPVQILFHGYRSCAFRDCSGGHALARKLGLNTLVIDQRAHGKSGGTVITFGIKERQDCLRWAHYAYERFGCDIPLILSGLSMGAATVLMASELDLPESVAAIIADSPYSTPAAIIEKVASDMHYPPALCRPFIHLSALLYGGFRLNECNAKDAVSHTKIPTLLIHGETDRLVPCSMSAQIQASGSGRIDLVTFPGAGHGLSYLTDPLRYEQSVFDFLRSIPSLRSHLPAELPSRKET